MRFSMDALIQDLERHFQFCFQNIKRREEDTSGARVLTSKARGTDVAQQRHGGVRSGTDVKCGSHSTTSTTSLWSNVSNGGHSGSKCVRSTAQLMGQTAMIKSDKDRQENVRK